MARKSSAGKACDRYYYNPEGKKFRSMAEVNRFLNAEAGEEGKDSSPARGRSKSPAKKAKSRSSSSKSPTKKAPTKKAPTKKKAPEAKKPSPPKQKYAVGTTVSKVFHDPELGEERPFSGEVISYDAKKTLYWVRYEDGDEGKSFLFFVISLFHVCVVQEDKNLHCTLSLHLQRK